MMPCVALLLTLFQSLQPYRQEKTINQQALAKTTSTDRGVPEPPLDRSLPRLPMPISMMHFVLAIEPSERHWRSCLAAQGKVWRGSSCLACGFRQSRIWFYKLGPEDKVAPGEYK